MKKTLSFIAILLLFPALICAEPTVTGGGGGGGSASVSDTAYDATTWDGVTTAAPSKNAVRDYLDTIQTSCTPGSGNCMTGASKNTVTPVCQTGTGKAYTTWDTNGLPYNCDDVSATPKPIVLNPATAATSLGTFPLTTTYTNAGTTGTTVKKLAKLTGAPSTAIIAATTDTNGIIGIVVSGAGTTGTSEIATRGQTTCIFDGNTTAGNYFGISTSVAGDCKDLGSAYPQISSQVLGRVLATQTSGAGTEVAVQLFGPSIQGQNIPYLGSGTGAQDISAYASGYYVCTGACQITIRTPAAGNQYFIRNAPGSATAITLVNIASSYYEKTDHSGYGTVNYKLVSSGTALDSIGLLGLDSTHYLITSFVGSWADTAP